MTPRYRPHVAARPSWRCRVCGVAWPCSPARLALLGEYRNDRAALLIYLAATMHTALQDLDELTDQTSPDQLAQRFMGWAKARGS